MARFPRLLTPAAVLLTVLLVALPSGALSFERRGEGYCGGQAPVVLACQAQPLTVSTNYSTDLEAKVVCQVLAGCSDGFVQVDLDATGPTWHLHRTCWFGELANTCLPSTHTGTLYAGQDIQVTGSASLHCEVAPCSAPIAVADWTVAIYA